jgi:DNA-binding transcriptional MerR regulator
MEEVMMLAPPNRGALRSGLALTQMQLAALCGVTARQISHWTNRGYITPAGRRPVRYSGGAIDQCMLTKQGLDKGLPPRRAVALARSYLADERARQPGVAALEPRALAEVREQLRAAESSIASVRQSIEPLVPQSRRAAEATAGAAGGGDGGT